MGKALLDCVLVASRKSGEHKFPGIWMARVYGQLVAIFDRLDHLIDIGEIEPRMQTLRVHVECNGNEVDIASALTIAKQAALDAVAPCQQAQLGCGDSGAAVIMRVQTDNHRFAVRNIAAEILNLIRIDVGHCRLYGGRQVEYDRLFNGRLQDFHNGAANFDAEIQFGSREGFRRIFKMPIGLWIFCGLLCQDLRPFNRNRLHARLIEIENNVTPSG